jgi:hypothetical protein
MKTLYQSLLLAIGALALAGTAHAQVPSTNDTSTTDNRFNTGMGTSALGGPTPMNLTGSYNTAAGYQALLSNTYGYDNTASGAFALKSNTTGYDDTASGLNALLANTTGFYNTAVGSGALQANSTGFQNTAIGVAALDANTIGGDNTACGAFALQANTTGSSNTASGFNVLNANTTGANNTASGINALMSNTTGNRNTASGKSALQLNTTGSNNIAEGIQAGVNLTTGSNNIDIGNKGATGDNNTIKVGTQGTQAATYIAGIYNVPLTGNAVVVTSTGQLGVAAQSSERFKTAIAPMGSNTAKLEQLRPVTFHYKQNPHGALQYGLIAEEVAKLYPELVIRNEAGRIDGVRYDELAPMLLNEAQQQQQKIAAQAAEIQDLKQQLMTHAVQLKGMQQQMAELHAALLKPKAELVAQR